MDNVEVLIMRDALAIIIEERVNALIEVLTQLFKEYGDTPCMAHTRRQRAIPITFGIGINAWARPLKRQVERLEEIKRDYSYYS